MTPTSGRAAISTIRSWPRPGLPQGEELKILEPFRGKIPDEVFTKEYDPPKYDGSGNIRDGLREALKLLKEAGWSVKGGKLVNDKTGQPFEFEILLVQPEFERIVLPFVRNLERMGITARVRTVDASQYQKRMDTFDYDMAVDVVRPVAVARQRAARLLGIAGRRRGGQPQRSRDQEPGHRRAGRGASSRRRTARLSSPTRARSTACCNGAFT